MSAVGGDGGGPEGLCDVSPISTFSKTEVRVAGEGGTVDVGTTCCTRSVLR